MNNRSRQNTELACDLERNMKNQFDAVVSALDRYVMATRQRREPIHHHGFYNLGSSSTINQSNVSLPSLYGSRSTITEVQSIAGQSDVSSRHNTLFKRLEIAAAKKQPKTMPATTANTNASKVAFIPAGFERDVLEFYKYNDI